MRYQDLVQEAKIIAEHSDKANAARARNLAKVVKKGCDRNDDNNRQRTVTTIKAIKKADERSEKRDNDLKATVTSDGEKTRKLIARTSGNDPVSVLQFFWSAVFGLVTGVAFFCILYFGAKLGVYFSTNSGMMINRTADGNYLGQVIAWEPFMPAIYFFTLLAFVAGLLAALSLFNRYNVRHSK
ncbi:hypothetical protein IK110_00475 [Candidatus Saccharibacteria bacterium]|nr:hypothetical protein [Candidatus Saccharibacteria bacterium]